MKVHWHNASAHNKIERKQQFSLVVTALQISAK